MIKQIKKLIEDGFAAKRIAQNLKLNFKDVQEIIIKNNYTIKKEIFNINLIPHIVSLYEDGVSAKNLGIKYSIDKRRIQKWAKRKNILRNKNDTHRFVLFDQNYFDKIDTPAKAYWLGFLYADGYNNKETNTVSVSLAYKDHNHLIKLAKAIGLSKNKITIYNSNIGDKAYPSSCLRMYSKHMCNILSNKGCPQAKSFIITYPDWLFPELNSHFIRGIFDGDGCLTKRSLNSEWKWSIASTKEICNSINFILNNELDITTTICNISQTNNNTYEMQTSGNEKIHKIMKWLHENSTESIRLDRKYDKYEELIEQQNNRRVTRKNYFIPEMKKNEMLDRALNGENIVTMAEEFKINPITITRLVQSKKLEDNPNLKPRKKTWKGNLNFPQTNNISNDVNNLFMDEFIVWKGNKLSNKFLRTVDEDKRDEIAKDIFNFYLNYDFDKIKISDKKVESGWNSLKKYEPKLEIIDNVTYLKNSGTSGCNVYKNYFPNIIKVKGSTRPSIYDVVTNKEKLWATIRNRIGNTLLYNDDRKGIPVQYPMNQTLSQLFIGAKNSGLASMGSIFKPTVAKAIYQKWVKNGFNVLDYSCGFGTRLLGLMSCEFENVKYFGYEPNTETYNGLIDMINHFKFNAEIKKCGSEEKEIFDEKMDFVFSSPPYFNQEKYSDEPTQCYNKYPDYDKWLENYWRKTVQNISQMIKDEGVFAVNIGNQANAFMQKLETDLNKIIIEEGFKLVDTWYMKTSKSHLSGKKGDPNKKVKLEGIFFYKKNI